MSANHFSNIQDLFFLQLLLQLLQLNRRHPIAVRNLYKFLCGNQTKLQSTLILLYSFLRISKKLVPTVYLEQVFLESQSVRNGYWNQTHSSCYCTAIIRYLMARMKIVNLKMQGTQFEKPMLTPTSRKSIRFTDKINKQFVKSQKQLFFALQRTYYSLQQQFGCSSYIVLLQEIATV